VRPSAAARRLALLPILAALAACAPGGATAPRSPAGPVAAWRLPEAPPRPAACRDLAAGADLAGDLASAREGDALCLAVGDWAGPARIGRGVTVWGPRGARLRSSGRGSTVSLGGEGARLLGVTVDGSGGRFDTLDAAIRVEASGATVAGVRVVNAVFGILCERVARVAIRANEVVGPDRGPLGLRGDGIRLWETSDSLVEDNHVVGGRDVVIWYSPRNVVRRNLVERGRYGTHYMYSHDNVAEDNRYLGNVVGVFVMYSRGIELRRNVMAGGTGAAGMGLGVKEAGNVVAEDNALVANTVGAYLDTTPLQVTDRNAFRRNLLAFADTGIVLHGSERHNAFEDNAFRGNAVQVAVEGGGDAQGCTWRGNFFDDQPAYDLDGDGFSDAPYELRSLSQQLVALHPDLAFFHGTPALALAEAASRFLPLFAPRLVLVDERPRMAPLPPVDERPRMAPLPPVDERPRPAPPPPVDERPRPAPPPGGADAS
jgi:nitrous oxidase accessory protein